MKNVSNHSTITMEYYDDFGKVDWEKEAFDKEKEVFDKDKEGFDKEKEVFDKDKEAFDKDKEAFDKEKDVFDKDDPFEFGNQPMRKVRRQRARQNNNQEDPFNFR
jgi:hypothetical protein